jgi:2-polyprenyl-6-methoxyphenol hydroxylase-like FAD-dependent oxidoreductase
MDADGTTTPASVGNEEDQTCNVQQTSCCIVGAGPGGAILALLLARRGVTVTLLEAHKDFEREFRGDTIHPSVMEILDQVGLAERLHQLRHTKMHGLVIQAANGPFLPFDLRSLKTRFPYILMVPQSRFLEFITGECAKYPNFRLIMRASAQRLIEEQGSIRGVQYSGPDGLMHDVRATLTVGADGRFSQVRRLAGIEPVKTSPPMDVLWFRLPRLANDPCDGLGASFGLGRGRILIVLERVDYWQAGLVFPKGTYQEVRGQGLEMMRRSLAEIAPPFAPHMESLTDWQQFSLLSADASRCRQWYKPGLLLIGDAAHVMSPVGGLGINYAIQDATVAANVLARPLLQGQVGIAQLREVQRLRERPTKIVQAFQAFAQKRIIAAVLGSQQKLSIPWFVRFLARIPMIRAVPARLVAFGPRRVRVE